MSTCQTGWCERLAWKVCDNTVSYRDHPRQCVVC